jgi:hypothetical protein
MRSPFASSLLPKTSQIMLDNIDALDKETASFAAPIAPGKIRVSYPLSAIHTQPL